MRRSYSLYNITPMTYITSLTLQSFRNYDSAALNDLPAGPVVLYGSNGAGKTNILEAISFLAPGRGLRGARISEIQRVSDRAGEAITPWVISALAETSYGETRIGTGADPDKERRIIRINGADASQNTLSEYLACVWLTPQMDRLFMDAASSRRRFLDRLIFAFDPAHAGRVSRYEKNMGQRSRVLKDHSQPDPLWLDALEAGMAETGVAIAAARLDFSEKLQQACDRADMVEAGFFPKARVRVAGTVEELLSHSPALEVEEMFRYQLKESRLQDARTGGAATGPHKTDLNVVYAAKNMPADQCSTGEQKALLIGLIMAHSRMITAERGSPPVLLLDEVAAHLDQNRRQALYDLLRAMKCQVWMTGTDQSLFAAIEKEARIIRVEQGQLHPVLRNAA